MRHLILFILLGSISFSGFAQSDIQELREEYRQRLEGLMKKNKIRGLSFAVFSQDSVLLEYHGGFSDEKLTREVRSETLFGLGSVTKVFTGAAVMQLADQGLIALDAPMQAYLPQLQIKGEYLDEVRVRNVMTHHSGLPSDIVKGMFTQNPEPYERTVDYLNEEFMAARPQQVRAYSNPGYTLLGQMVAEVSGKPFQEYLKDSVLTRLGMEKSDFNLRDEASAVFDRKGKPGREVLLRDLPAGGLYSNLEEMIIFLRAYLEEDEKLFSREAYRQIFTEQHPHLPLNFGNRYALGWSMTDRPYTGTVFTHTGTMMYFNSAVAVVPELGLAAVALTNSQGGGGAFSLMMDALNDVAKLGGEEPKESRMIEAFSNGELIELPDSVTDQYVGMYAAPGAILEVFKKNDKLFSRLQGLKVRLLPVAVNEFIPKIMLLGFIPLKLSETRFTFEEVAGHRLITQSEIGSTKDLMVTWVEPYPLSSDWQNRLGEYRVVNKLDGEVDFFTDFELCEEKGLLVMKFRQGSQDIEMALEVTDSRRAKVAGLGRYAGQSLQVREDGLLFFGLNLQKKLKNKYYEKAK